MAGGDIAVGRPNTDAAKLRRMSVYLCTDSLDYIYKYDCIIFMLVLNTIHWILRARK